MSLTHQIVQKILDIKFEDIPKTTVDYARFVVLDSVGSALAASHTKIGQLLINLSCNEETGSSLVWGTDKFAPLSIACFINSALSQILDFDDTYEINTLAVSHPGPAVVPLSLSLADNLNQNGEELIRAIVLGYEMCMRFASAVEPRNDEYFGFSNSQIIGAVTSASILLGLDVREFTNAFGLAVSTSPVANTKPMWGLENRPMSWIKDGIGFVSTTALLCSQMASLGFQATMQALDPSNKFYVLCGSQNFKSSKLIEGLGSDFQIQNISFKPYPTCRFIQSTLDVVKKIVCDKRLADEDILKIQIFITPYLLESFLEKTPSTIIDAQFSLPYAIAMVVLGKTPSPEWYEIKTMNDFSVRTIMDKVELLPDEAGEAERKQNSDLKTKVKIILKNNHQYYEETGFAKGNPRNPFSEEEHIQKFQDNLVSHFDKGKIEMLSDAILTIDKTTKVKDLVTGFRSS